MKKHFIIAFCVAILCCMSSIAQVRDPDFKKELLVGAKAGVSIPNVLFSPAIEQNAWVGYTAGVALRYTEEKLFGLVVEANITQRGWDEMFKSDPYQYRRTLTYVEIPFMTHIYFGSDKVHGFVNLGPQLGILIGEEKQANFDTHNLPPFSNPNTIPDSYELPVKNILDYGITGGLGVELRMNRNIVVLEGRYYFGLGDIFGNSKADVFYGSSANHGFLVSVSYMFSVWK